MHVEPNNLHYLPFTIGQIDPKKGYVHVFDDTTLEVVMKTLDTISDFTRYLSLKEQFILSGRLLMSTGEEDLLAYYLQQVDQNGEHTFLPKAEKQFDGLIVTEGEWEDFLNHPSRLAQISCNEISYSWDKLIEKFMFHVTSGTSYHLSHPDLKIQDQIFRMLAKENRTKRRLLAESIHELIEKTPENMRTTRLLDPEKISEPYYLFLLLPFPKFLSYEKYREVRGDLLNRYLSITKLNCPEALDIIGLATETGFPEKRSEDFVYLDARIWSDEDNQHALKLEKELLYIGMIGEKTNFRKKIEEYPDIIPRNKIEMKGKKRNMICPYCNSGKKFKKCCGAN